MKQSFLVIYQISWCHQFDSNSEKRWKTTPVRRPFTFEGSTIHLYKTQNQAAVPRSFVFSWKSSGKTVKVHPSWGTCFCWKWTERNVGFQRYHSCKATAGNSYSIPGTMSTTHCSFSVFISAPFIHEFYSLAHSEQHTVGNDTYSIIHIALNFISFAVKKRKKHCTHLHLTPHRQYGTKSKNTNVYCFFPNWVAKQVTIQIHKLNTQTCSGIKYWKVSQTPGQMLMWFPKEPPCINRFLQEKMEAADLSRKMRFVWCCLLAEMESEMGWREKELKPGAGNLSSQWR